MYYMAIKLFSLSFIVIVIVIDTSTGIFRANLLNMMAVKILDP